MTLVIFQNIATYEFTSIELIAQFLYGALSALLFIFGLEMLNKYRSADEIAKKDSIHLFFMVIAYALIGYSLYNPSSIELFLSPRRGMKPCTSAIIYGNNNTSIWSINPKIFF